MKSGIEALNLEKGFGFEVNGLSSHHHNEIKKSLEKNVSNDKWSNIVHKIPSYKYFYTDELKEMVLEIFKEDFDMYQYTFEEFLKTN